MSDENKDTSMLWVAVDVGCIECGEPSDVFGVFTSQEQAQATCDAWYAHDNGWRGGQHSYQVIPVDALNKASLPVVEEVQS